MVVHPHEKADVRRSPVRNHISTAGVIGQAPLDLLDRSQELSLLTGRRQRLTKM
jgi:hypothetical protein